MSTSALDSAARIADPNTVVPTAWLTAILLRRHDGAAAIALGTSAAVAAEEAVKRRVWEHRPRLFARTAWRSFPSGHSAASTAYGFGLALVAPHPYRPLALVVASLATVGVNALRLAARRHWLRDVLVGDAIGIMGILTAHVALGAIRRMREARPSDIARPAGE